MACESTKPNHAPVVCDYYLQALCETAASSTGCVKSAMMYCLEQLDVNIDIST